MGRTALLGGEVRRRGLISRLHRLEAIGLAITTGSAVLILLSSTLTSIIVAVAVFLTGVLLFVPWGFQRRSVSAGLVREWRWWMRTRKGLTTFLPPGIALNTSGPSRQKARRTPHRPAPDAVGRVRLIESGPGPAQTLAVLHHMNPGTQDYLSAVLEVDGVAGGLREEYQYDQAAQRFGQLLASRAKQSSLTRGVQLLNRVVPLDSAAHEAFIQTRIHPDAPRQLIESYRELVQITAQASEQHRNYLVIRVPLAADFFDAAKQFGTGDPAWARVIFEELTQIASLARLAGMANARGVTRARLAALLRSLQDPDFYVDQADVDLATCWQPSRAGRRSVVTNEKWHTRIARVPATGLPAQPVHTRWLAPLLTDITPAVIRTVSVLIDLVPAGKARREAVSDVAVDRSNIQSKQDEGRVSDGTEAVQMSASRTRLDDLSPGSGQHGTRFAIYLAVTAPGDDEIRRACRQVEEKAEQSGISQLEWLDLEHDTAAATCWPMWRGLKVSA